MADGISVDIKGLDKLKDNLAGRRVQKVFATQLGLAVIQFESKVSEAVKDIYYTPHEPRTALVKRPSKSTATTGKNLLTYDIVYKFIPVPLHQFPFKEFEVPVSARFLVPGGGNRFKVIKKTTARAVAVKIRRKEGFKVAVGKKGYGGFYQKGGSSKWAKAQGGVTKSYRTGIYERETSDTWHEEPITRAETALLFGPSLAQMVSTAVEISPILQEFINNLENVVASGIEL